MPGGQPRTTPDAGDPTPVTDGGRIRPPDCCPGFDGEDELREHARENHGIEDPIEGD